ncbi:MAG: LLM class flavin-dependent oxidoreductase [Acidimicrobiales bacterium]|nr:LLM class flavin-dependent oxidoreductase [Acidimicrobiales bacterium]
MFRTWFFTEMPYPSTPPPDAYDSVRVTLPNAHCDPEELRRLYDLYFDLYRACDSLGLDIMLNEHHQTATCLDVAVPLSMAIIARETTTSRILALGNPIANRADPIRVAEEMAMVDVLSGGRIEVGFVRGVPQEVSATNVSPVGMYERFWEAADLIVRAWTSHDGPFSWEGDYFHHRQVNIWPRPYQQPHPPLWVPTQSASTAAAVARRGYCLGTILAGVKGARELFEVYRSTSVEAGLGPAAPERLGYCALVFVGATESAARSGAEELDWYLKNNKVANQFNLPPGYLPAAARAEALRRLAHGEEIGSPIAHLATASIDQLAEEGFFFFGTPDQVVDQITSFHDAVGGFGNLLLMGHGGHMDYDTTVGSLELYAREVQPRLRAAFDGLG